jgi:Spy/CpxP family protein refolding chaperone
MMMSAAMAVAPPQASAVGNLADKLQLTDDQTAKLQEVTAAGDKALKPLKQKADDAAKALRTAVLSPTFDAAKVKDAAAKAQKAETDVISVSISTWTQIRSVLTPDQETQLQDLMRDLRPGPGGTPPSPPSGTDGPPAPPSTDQ